MPCIDLDYLRQQEAAEDAAYQACINAAAQAMRTFDQAYNCHDGDLKCPHCPFWHKEVTWGGKKKIYVAGKFQDRWYIRWVMAELQDRGHTITCDWTRHELAQDDPERQAKCRAFAQEDFQGVAEADLVILILEKDFPYKGSYVEMGMALARNIDVWVLGQAGDSCIFMNLPQIRKFGAIEFLLNELTPALYGGKHE